MKVNSRIKLMSTIMVLFFMLIYGCKKHDLTKITGITFDQNLAVPIGYGEFGLHDLLKSVDSIISINPNDGEMSLVYHKQLDTIYAKDVIKLRDTSTMYNIITPTNLGSYKLGSYNSIFSSAISQSFNYETQNGSLLHTVNFESGSLVLNISSTIKHDITLKVTFPDITTVSGNAVSKTINLIYANSLPQIGTGSIDLSNLKADFTAGATADNTLRINIEATVKGTGQPIVGDENLNMSMNLSNLKFRNITGYFGQQTLASFTDSMLLKIFNNPISGSLGFTNPRVKFNVENSFGIPITVNFNSLSSVNTVTNQTTQITMNPPNQLIAAPSDMGQPAVTTIIELSNATTNNTISNLVETTPKYLKYNISATSNVGGNKLPLNFIESTSKMIIKADVDLPFEGYASGMEVKDTLSQEFDYDVNTIESVLFRVKVDNGFPLTFSGQAEFVDENYNHLFDLFDSPTDLILAAPVNSTTHIVTSKTSKTTDVILNEAKIKLLSRVKYIIMKGNAETTKPQNTIVKLLDSYKIGLKLSVQVQLKGK
jgi:hypothetical protein